MARKKGVRGQFEFAIKSIPKELSAKRGFKTLKRELSILRIVDHPNIIKLYEIFEDEKYVHIVTEMCYGCDLFEYSLMSGPLSEKEAGNIMYKLLSGVNHLHALNIVHRDLKPDNVLFTDQNPESELKIIDFGLSSKFEEIADMSTIVGTPYFVAPEVLRKRYVFGSDVWSLGVIMYMLLSGYPPFQGQNPRLVFKEILQVNYNFDAPIWRTISKEAQDLISKIFIKNPNKRITIQEALNHKWFKKARKPRSPRKTTIERTLGMMQAYKIQSRLQSEAMKIIIKFVPSEYIDDLKDVFCSLDHEKTGLITAKQMIKAMRKLGLKAVGDEIKSMVQKVGYLSDGQINYSNFLSATLDAKAKLSEQVLFETFNHIDAQNKGFITSENFAFAFNMAGLDIEESDVNEMMTSFQLSDNVNLDFEAFKRIILKPPDEGTSTPSIAHIRRMDRLSSTVIDKEAESYELLARSFATEYPDDVIY